MDYPTKDLSFDSPLVYAANCIMICVNLNGAAPIDLVKWFVSKSVSHSFQ